MGMPVTQDKVVLRMNRLLASEEEIPLKELLRLLDVYFEDGVVSIVYGEERDILATTGSRDEVVDIENVAFRIKDTENKEYYLRSEVNGLYFRKGYHCIRVFPFSQVVNEPCFLLVEQKTVIGSDINMDRVIDFLSIAVRLHILTRDKVGKRKSGDVLLERDDFLGCLRREDVSENGFLGVFHIANMQELNKKVGNNGVDTIINDISSIMERVFPEAVCRISTTKYAVVVCGEMYQAVCMLQDVLDDISSSYPKVKVKCVTTKVCEDIYRTMYVCERASENVGGDAVVVIREGGEEFVDGRMEQTAYYNADDVEEYEDVSYQEVETEPVELENARKEYNAKKEREEAERKNKTARPGNASDGFGDNVFPFGGNVYSYEESNLAEEG